MRPSPRAVALAVVLATVGAAPTAAAAARKAPRLKAFASCAQLVSYARANALRTGGTGGVTVRAGLEAPVTLTTPAATGTDTATIAPGAPAPAASAPAATAAPVSSDSKTFSTTNVQEPGIDEPDIVKTDGKHIFAVANQTIEALDVSGGTPRLVGSLQLDGFGQQLLLRGTRLLVLSSGPAIVALPPQPIAPLPNTSGPVAVGAPAFFPGRTQTILTEVDVSDPAAMHVARTLTLEGDLVSARMVDGSARVVVNSAPAPIAVPLDSGGASPPAAQRAAIRKTGVRTYVPLTVTRSRISGHTFRRAVVPCGQVRRPPVFSGLDLLSVLTIDLDKGLYSVDRDAVLAGAQTVYASNKSLYVASIKYSPQLETDGIVSSNTTTQIARFDMSDPDRTTYAATGEVPGFIVNQFALSEDAGVLRVASTFEPPWLPTGQQAGESESFVTVLDQRGTTLQKVGQVGGIGRGERIQAVRFLGDQGYIVTFRRVDPLFTLDLSDPTAPKVAGRLDLLGFSAYLHPLADGLLLGVGQDATPQGVAQGLQLSLFDVSNPRRPALLAHHSVGANSSSDAEFDHHAFLYWPPTKLTVLPVNSFPLNSGESFTGAIGFRVQRSAIAEVGRIEHVVAPPQPQPQPQPLAQGGPQPTFVPAPSSFEIPLARSLVIGDRVFSLSYAGVLASTLDTLAPVGFVAFPSPTG